MAVLSRVGSNFFSRSISPRLYVSSASQHRKHESSNVFVWMTHSSSDFDSAVTYNNAATWTANCSKTDKST